MPPKIIIPIGTRFGKPVVTEGLGPIKGHNSYLCQCDCGNAPTVRGSSLLSKTKAVESCGCLQLEKAFKHGYAGTPEYKAWQGIKLRCYNPRIVNYGDYGGRGIRMWEPWINDPVAFCAYVGPRPSPEHSVDRYPNNDGNYEPGNVRWATPVEQQNNTRINSRLTLDGRTLSMSRWAFEPQILSLGLSRSCLVHRKRKGLSDHDILTRPLKRRLRE